MTVVSHDRYAEIINKAKSESLVMFKSYVLGEDGNDEKKAVVNMPPAASGMIAAAKSGQTENVYIPQSAGITTTELTPELGMAMGAVQEVVNERAQSLSACDLTDNATFKAVVETAAKKIEETTGEKPEEETVTKACQALAATTIAIPKVLRMAKDVVVQGFDDFDLDTKELKTLNPVNDKVKVTSLVNGKEVKVFDGDAGDESSNYLITLIGKLRAAEEIDYEGNSELVGKLAQQAVGFLSQWKQNEDVAANILRNNMDAIVEIIRRQLAKNAHYDGGGYKFKVVTGCCSLGLSSALIGETDKFRDFAVPLDPGERSKIKSMVFTGFKKCLYEKQKFESNPERLFAVIIDRCADVIAWFRPQYSGFSIRRNNGENYFPDFVVETKDAKYICEVKADNEADDADVKDKAEAAIEWCAVVTEAEAKENRKPWKYVFVTESKIDEALEFDVAVQKYTLSKKGNS